MEDWEKIYKTTGEVEKIVHPLVKNAIPIFRQNNVKKILDLGCGTGRHTVYLANLGFQLTATDISEGGLKILRKKLKSQKIKNVELKHCDMASLPFPDGYFDVILSIYVIYHATLDKIIKTIDEIYRVLKNGGIVVLNTLSTENPRYGTGKEIEPNTFLGTEGPYKETDVPHHFFSKDELLDLFSKFEIITFNPRYKNPETGKKTGHWEIIARKIQ